MSSALDVVGIGSMVVDRVHRAPRLLGGDEKGVLRDVEGAGPVRAYVGGVVLNHIGWAAALGLRAGIFGRQGDDAEGRFLRAAMDRLGIERDLELGSAATSVAEIFVDDEGTRAIYMAPGATSATTAEHVRSRHAGFVRRARRLSTEVSQLPLAAALAAVEIAREAGIPTALDLDVPPSAALETLGDERELDALLRAADWLKPAKAAARECVTGADALDLARAMRARYGNAAVIVTDGEAGCAVVAEAFEGWVRAQPVTALDTTGAGDAFLGGLLAGERRGLDWQDAARLANACGAACVEKLGAFPDDPAAARARVLELYDGAPLELGPMPKPADRGDPSGEEALGFLGLASEEIEALRARLDPKAFEAAVSLIRASERSGGRVHVTGVGKPEHVARYAASLLCSVGTPATFLHATEVVHGSAGQVLAGDVVIAVSNSGETEELRAAMQAVRRMKVHMIAVTGNRESWLARHADAVLDAGVRREGGPLGLAPRVSVAAEVLVLAALAAGLERESGFTRADYHLRHPAGALGDRLRRE